MLPDRPAGCILGAGVAGVAGVVFLYTELGLGLGLDPRVNFYDSARNNLSHCQLITGKSRKSGSDNQQQIL